MSVAIIRAEIANALTDAERAQVWLAVLRLERAANVAGFRPDDPISDEYRAAREQLARMLRPEWMQ